MDPQVTAGTTAIVLTLSYWQALGLVGSVFATGFVVLFGVWLSNRELRTEVKHFRKEVVHLGDVVEKLDENVDAVRIANAANAALEKRVDNLERHCFPGPGPSG